MTNVWKGVMYRKVNSAIGAERRVDEKNKIADNYIKVANFIKWLTIFLLKIMVLKL